MNEFSFTKDSALDQHDNIDAGNDCPIVDTDKDNRKVSGEYSAISVNHCDDESAVSANQVCHFFKLSSNNGIYL